MLLLICISVYYTQTYYKHKNYFTSCFDTDNFIHFYPGQTFTGFLISPEHHLQVQTYSALLLKFCYISSIVLPKQKTMKTLNYYFSVENLFWSHLNSKYLLLYCLYPGVYAQCLQKFYLISIDIYDYLQINSIEPRSCYCYFYGRWWIKLS